MTAPLFAHQGGWDEILLVVAPLALIGLLLWVANRRLANQLEQEAVAAATAPEARSHDSAGLDVRSEVGDHE